MTATLVAHGEATGIPALSAALGVALRKIYNLKIDTITEEVKAHFTNVRSLAQYIRSQGVG